jgi:hypothetical protein
LTICVRDELFDLTTTSVTTKSIHPTYHPLQSVLAITAITPILSLGLTSLRALHHAKAAIAS